MRAAVASWFEVLARIGYLAKGVLYLTICALAARAALGLGGAADADRQLAIEYLYTEPLGRVLVWIIAVGLAGYAAWKLFDAITDPDHRGRSPKALAIRIGRFSTGVSHLGLAIGAAALALERTTDADDALRDAAATTFATRSIVIGLWIGAACCFAFGAYQLYRAWTAKLSRDLDAKAMRRALVIISRFGIAARGIVFVTTAVLCAHAAYEQDAKRVGGTGESMLAILTSFGWWPYLVVASGLGAYGVYQLINARFRSIRFST